MDLLMKSDQSINVSPSNTGEGFYRSRKSKLNLPFNESNIFRHSLYKKMHNHLIINDQGSSPLNETIKRIKLNQDSQQYMKRHSQLSGIRHVSVKNKRESLDSNAFMIDFSTLIFDDNVARPSKKKRESNAS